VTEDKPDDGTATLRDDVRRTRCFLEVVQINLNGVRRPRFIPRLIVENPHEHFSASGQMKRLERA